MTTPRPGRLATACLALAALCATAPARAEIVRLARHPAPSPDGERIAFSWRGDIFGQGHSFFPPVTGYWPTVGGTFRAAARNAGNPDCRSSTQPWPVGGWRESEATSTSGSRGSHGCGCRSAREGFRQSVHGRARLPIGRTTRLIGDEPLLGVHPVIADRLVALRAPPANVARQVVAAPDTPFRRSSPSAGRSMRRRFALTASAVSQKQPDVRSTRNRGVLAIWASGRTAEGRTRPRREHAPSSDLLFRSGNRMLVTYGLDPFSGVRSVSIAAQ